MPNLEMTPGVMTEQSFEGQIRQIEPVAIGPNWLVNGACQIQGRGVGPFTSTTVPANNDDTYLIDGCYLLSDGNDIADIKGAATSSLLDSGEGIEFDIETANKKCGMVWPVEWNDAREIIRVGSASAQCKAFQTSGATIGAIRMHIVGWDGTVDAPTSDMVSAWGAAGVNFTPVANWVILGTGTLTLTSGVQVCVINGAPTLPVYMNLALFIALDDTTMSVGDKIIIGDVKLEAGPKSTPFVTPSNADAVARCRRYFFRANRDQQAGAIFHNGYNRSATSFEGYMQYPVRMRASPTITFGTAADFEVKAGASTSAPSALSAAPFRDGAYITSTVSGHTVGDGGVLRDDGGGLSYIDFSAEL